MISAASFQSIPPSCSPKPMKWKTSPATTLANKSPISASRSLRDADHSMRLTHQGTPTLLRRTQRIRERSRSFFDAFPPRDGRFSFSRHEREAFLEQNRESYDALVNSLKGLETEFAALTQKPEELLRIA